MFRQIHQNSLLDQLAHSTAYNWTHLSPNVPDWASSHPAKVAQAQCHRHDDVEDSPLHKEVHQKWQVELRKDKEEATWQPGDLYLNELPSMAAGYLATNPAAA